MKKLLFFFLSFLTVCLQAQENPVSWSFSSKMVNDCECDLIFKATIEAPWHIYSLNRTKDGPNPTVFTFKKSPDYELVGKVKQSKPVKEFDKVFEMNVEYFSKEATFTQRVKLLTDKEVKIAGKYEFQACTEEKCIFPPADNFELKVKGNASCTKNN